MIEGSCDVGRLRAKDGRKSTEIADVQPLDMTYGWKRG
jgi:hypothetical protein